MAGENQTKNPGKGVHSSILKTLLDLAFIAFCAGLSMFYLFVGNLTELLFSEIVLPLLIFIAIGWVLYLMLRLILKSPRKAAVISGIIMAVLTNAGMLTDSLGYAAVLIISTVITVAVFVIFIRVIKENITEKIEYIAAGILAGLILFNIAISVPQFIENKRMSDEAAALTASLEEAQVPAQYDKEEADLPNTYIFIFDELAGTKCMNEVFGYDNTWFYNDMRELGFTVSGSCTNYKQFTLEALSGVFNLDYMLSYEKHGALACAQQLKDAKFFGLMKEMGYEMYETEVSGFVDFEKRIQNGSSKEYNITEDGKTTLDVILGRTIFGPLVGALGIYPSNYELYDEILTYYTLPESFTYENAMTFTYICCPHAPFLYDVNGDPVDEQNGMNWTDSKYFIEQYEYMCGRIKDTMQGIIKNDPDAVILVLSDHGVKSNKYLWDGPETTFEQSMDTFFAVYTGGRDDIGDISGLSGANVLRTVLNKEYGFDFEMAAAPEN